jgi:hypothetical protein
LGSVRTEIASVELDALALLFVHERRDLLRRDAVRKERNVILHPILMGGEDLKRITDQIERSFLDPLGAEDDAVRIEAVGEDQGRAFAFDNPVVVGEERSIADLRDGRPKASLSTSNPSRPPPPSSHSSGVGRR